MVSEEYINTVWKKKEKKLLFKACAGNILKFQSTRGFEINTYLSEVNWKIRFSKSSNFR